MKKLTGSRIGNLIVVAAVVIVPLLYAGLLTLAYQNPTNRLSDLKAAVVNEDTAYTATLADGSTKTLDLGAELEDALVHPDGSRDVGFTWESMPKAQAEADMTTEKVRAILYIPAGFSENVAAVGSKDPSAAATQQLRLVTDDGVNYLAGTMAITVAKELTTELDNQGSSEVLDTLLLSVSTIRDGMVDAADGASQLKDGTTELKDGTATAVDGAARLNDGAQTLVVGMRQLADGSVTLRNGLVVLRDGTATAADGSGQLASGLDTLAAGAASASDGSARLADGAGQVADGTAQMRQQVPALEQGASKLVAGSSDLSEGIAQYTAGVGQVAAGAAALQAKAADPTTGLAAGVAALKAGVGQPADQYDVTAQSNSLYAGVNSVDAGAQALAKGLEDAGKQVPTLKTGASDLATGAAAAQKGVKDYTDAVARLVAACQQAQGAGDKDQALADVCQGLTVLNQKSADLNDGASQVAKGAARVSAGVNQVADQMPTAVAGAKQVATGTAALKQGVSPLYAGVNQLAAGVGTATDVTTPGDPSSPQTLMGGINAVAGGLQQLTGNSAKLNNGATELSGGLGLLGSQVPSLISGVNRLDAGAQQVSTGASDLATGLGILKAGSSTAASKSHELAAGLARLEAGASDAASGSATLADGIGTARSGATQLADGTTQLADGAVQLDDGATQLADGAGELSDGLSDGVEKIPDYTDSQRDTMVNVASDVAKVDAVRENAVHNNGAGFTPMFMSLSLWVGAIALFLVLPALDKRDHGEKWWASAIRPATTASLLAVAQAIIMMCAVDAAGELHAKNLVGLCTMAIAASLTFMAVNQACVAALAFRGRFVSIVLLSLQITSMGATFPIETTPKFFQWVHPYLPMSYTQLAFRRLIAGGGVDGIYWQTLAVLVVWLVISIGVILLGARFRRGKRPLPADNALAPTAG